MTREEIWQAVEEEHHFDELIVELEGELRQLISPELWQKILGASDLAIEQAVCVLELALNDKRPEPVSVHTIRA